MFSRDLALDAESNVEISALRMESKFMSPETFYVFILLLISYGFLQEVKGSSDQAAVAEPVNTVEDACFAAEFATDPKCKDLIHDTAGNRSCRSESESYIDSNKNVLKCTKDKVKKCIKDEKRRQSKLDEVGQTMKKQKCSSTSTSGNFVTIILATVFLGLFTVSYLM